MSCMALLKQIKSSSYLLKKNPQNDFIKGQLQKETKLYEKLIKQRHKEYIENLFSELDVMHDSNPKGYMEYGSGQSSP